MIGNIGRNPADSLYTSSVSAKSFAPKHPTNPPANANPHDSARISVKIIIPVNPSALSTEISRSRSRIAIAIVLAVTSSIVNTMTVQIEPMNNFTFPIIEMKPS